VAVFLLIGKTSALTMNIGGVVKDWMLIGLSVAVYKWVHRWSTLPGVLRRPPAASGRQRLQQRLQHEGPRVACSARALLLRALILHGAALPPCRSVVTQLNLVGYSVAFAAVCWYNYQKLQAVSSQLPSCSH
jgi:hypothetical protein